MQKLFAEFKLKDLTLKNRIVMPPMCMYCASENGMVTRWHIIPQAETIKKITGLPVSAGGLLSDAKDINDILNQNKADLVYLGRELLRNPYWVLKAGKELGVDLEWPKQYERAKLR